MEQEFQFFSDEDILEDEPTESSNERILKVRLDKWLWAARFFKTRAVARIAVEKGKVFYNGKRSKPTREIEIGATLQIRHGQFEKVVIVKGLSTRRRSTEESLQLFEETSESHLTEKQIYEQGSINSPMATPYSPAEQPKERRVIRFLRRSLSRGGHRSE